MKKARLITFAVLALLMAACVISILPNFRHRAEWKQVVAALHAVQHDRVKAAASAFARDRKTALKTVDLRELLSGGYLRVEDVRGLEDRDVLVTVASDKTSPQMVLLRVRTREGADILLLADGSIQIMGKP